MPGEGLGNIGIWIRRTEMCHSILILALDRNCLMIRAPPYSGKTSILQRLQHSAEHEVPQFGQVYYFNAALVTESMHFEEAWSHQLGISWGEACSPASSPKGLREGAVGGLQGKITLMLIDETQALYNQKACGSQSFWGLVKAMAPGSRERSRIASDSAAHRVVIIMAAAYGSQQSVLGAGYFSTPVAFPDSASVLMRWGCSNSALAG